jgi:hypothetical protein
MDMEPTITLHYIQKDGRRERIKLTQHTIVEARKVAKAMLHAANGLYTEVDICTDDGTIERVQNLGAPSLVGTIWEHTESFRMADNRAAIRSACIQMLRWYVSDLGMCLAEVEKHQPAPNVVKARSAEDVGSFSQPSVLITGRLLCWRVIPQTPESV